MIAGPVPMQDRAARRHSPSSERSIDHPRPSRDRNFKPLVLGQNQSNGKVIVCHYLPCFPYWVPTTRFGAKPMTGKPATVKMIGGG